MKEWHNLDENELLNSLKTNEGGLNTSKVQDRLEKYGRNELSKKKTDSFIKILLRQLTDPIVILLVITVFFCLLIHETIDALAITFIILIDLVMGTFQEWKAEKTAESLQALIKVKVHVLRNGKEEDIDSSDLVIGDIVLLDSGDKISADMRILSSNNFQVDESVLTGESMNVYKSSAILDGIVPLAERKNMTYAGTTVVTGRAKCVVVQTGIKTEIGKIAHEVNNTKETKSPLTIRMEKFSKQISLLVVAVAIIIALILVYKDVPGSEIFLSVIALSVSAMPEGLPLALTMALTIASNKMAKKNVIVKKLNSVESLGSCTVIASDKTGTLTVDEQTVKKILLPNGQAYKISGIGYNDEGTLEGPSEYLNQIQMISKLGVLNNEAGLVKKNNQFESYGDSIDIAFLALGLKAKVNTDDIKILGKIPYESENKYSAVFYEVNGEVRCTVKGSVEKILEFSDEMILEGNKPLDRSLIMHQNEELAKEGYRVIALADGVVSNFAEKEIYAREDFSNLDFMGLVGFIDPIREDVKASLEECASAGIKVKMITGDHPLTAFTIAKELGLVQDYEEVTTGADVESALEKGEEFFDDFVKSKKVFSRVTPIDKLKIVESYKRQGEFIAVTGDGVNDAPALRSANIGIAMGSGTDVAKETASMIIVDNSFKSIVSGVKEGRIAYSNIRKVSYMLLSCGLAEVLFFILAIAFNLPMPLVAIQLLWLNIVTDGLQDFALSFEKGEKNIMKEKPRSTKESVFNKELLSEVLIAGLTIGLIVFGVWVYLIDVIHMNVDVARGYIMVLMVFMQNIHVFNCRSEKQSTFKISLKKNPLIIFSIVSAVILQIIIMEVPVLSHFLKTETVPLIQMFYLLLAAFVILIVMELYKYIRYNRKNS